MFCPKCNSEIKDGLNFCTVCGNNLGSFADIPVSSADIPVAPMETPVPQYSQQAYYPNFLPQSVAKMYVDEYESKALQALTLAILSLCLPIPIVNFILVLVAASKKDNAYRNFVLKAKVNDLNLNERIRSATGKLNVASKLITVTLVLLWALPIIVLAIVASMLFITESSHYYRYSEESPTAVILEDKDYAYDYDYDDYDFDYGYEYHINGNCYYVPSNID